MDKVKERVPEKTFKEKLADVCGYIILLASLLLMVWLFFVNEANGQEIGSELTSTFVFQEEFCVDSITGKRTDYLTIFTDLPGEYRVVAYSPPNNTGGPTGGELTKDSPCPLWFYDTFQEKGVLVFILDEKADSVIAKREFH
jgi:hypothetical protein